MIGVSIRIAMSLGLHLRNEVPGTDPSKKETLVRIWWSLHSIECLVSSITGRPPIIPIEDSTVPLPKEPRTDSQPTSKRTTSSRARFMSSEESSRVSSSAGVDSYLRSTVSIALLMQKVLSGLYAPRTAVQSWQVWICSASAVSLGTKLAELPTYFRRGRVYADDRHCRLSKVESKIYFRSLTTGPGCP